MILPLRSSLILAPTVLVPHLMVASRKRLKCPRVGGDNDKDAGGVVMILQEIHAGAMLTLAYEDFMTA